MMTNSPLDCIELNPPRPPDHAVIWLHGLGADGHDFEPIVPQLGLPEDLAVRFIFPHAPPRPVTINGGYVMRAWYDIVDHDIDRGADLDGIKASTQAVTALIEQQVARGIPAANIVMAGFSQGGVIALETGARFSEPVAGIVALSTYVSEPSLFPAAGPNAPAIFMAHGTADTIVPHALGLAGRHALAAKAYRVTWREYAMPHAVCADEVRDIGRWLRSILQP